ncbi:MAG: IS200/IS605 family transposase [Bacteroidota bacterium]
MPQSLAKLYVHIVFSTKERFPFLQDKDIQEEMHAYLGGICRNQNSPALVVGGVTDHVHILSRLARVISVADLLKELKIQSSKWIKTKGGFLTKFRWQNGYGAFSVGQRELETVISYIRSQQEHHRKKTFQEEYRQFLKEYEIEYDEQYVWD